ncbi:MAG: helix-turn-helix transcriptional regulator [Haloarculaceae archaeon]
MDRRAVAVVLVVLAVPTVAAAGAASGSPARRAGPPLAAQQSVTPDVVALSVTLHDDGSAAWTVENRVRLTDDADVAAFEDLQGDVRTNRSAHVDRFRDRMVRTVRAAENATGREMRVANVTVETRVESLPRRYGVLTYRFEWTNFAASDGDRLRTGDALAGFFLDNESHLSVTVPAGYHVASVSPAADERGNHTVTWRGPAEFGADGPVVVAAPGTPTPRSATGGGLSPLLAGAVVLALGLVAAAALLARSRGGEGDSGGTDRGGESGDGGGGSGESGDKDGESGDEGSDEPPLELLSNEEQVLRTLDGAGGRMKQAALAEELDWTAAKTSQVLGDMREDGQIGTFRIGRENVVTLPDVDLTEGVGGEDASGDGGDESGDGGGDGT